MLEFWNKIDSNPFYLSGVMGTELDQSLYCQWEQTRCYESRTDSKRDETSMKAETQDSLLTTQVKRMHMGL